MIFDIIAQKNLAVKVRRMPSHLKTDTVDRPAEVSLSDVLGNDLVDKWAKVARKGVVSTLVVLLEFYSIAS